MHSGNVCLQAVVDDIQIVRAEGGDIVTLSSASMVYAQPGMVLLDGVKGEFFAKRLHHALVRYVTRDGSAVQAVEKILHERFATSIMVLHPVEWTRYEITEVLPIGSAPGRWGLAQMELLDQAHNSKAYNFLEVLHFEIAH